MHVRLSDNCATFQRRIFVLLGISMLRSYEFDFFVVPVSRCCAPFGGVNFKRTGYQDKNVGLLSFVHGISANNGNDR